MIDKSNIKKIFTQEKNLTSNLLTTQAILLNPQFRRSQDLSGLSYRWAKWNDEQQNPSFKPDILPEEWRDCLSMQHIHL